MLNVMTSGQSSACRWARASMSATRSMSTSSISSITSRMTRHQGVGFYIESIRNPRAFFDKAPEVRKSNPIVC